MGLSATYSKLLEREESLLESEMQNTSIHTQVPSSYSGGLSSAYGDLMSPSLTCNLSSFQPRFLSSRGSSSFSPCQLLAGYGCEEDSHPQREACFSVVWCPVQVNSRCGLSQPPCFCGCHRASEGRSCSGESWEQETHLRGLASVLSLPLEELYCPGYPFLPMPTAKSQFKCLFPNKASDGSANIIPPYFPPRLFSKLKLTWFNISWCAFCSKIDYASILKAQFPWI